MARFSLLEALKNKGIETYGGLKLTEITESGIVVEDSNGDKKEMACDTVVIAVGLKADDTLYNELVNEFDEVYRIGDCIKARKFIDAIQEAFQVAVDI